MCSSYPSTTIRGHKVGTSPPLSRCGTALRLGIKQKFRGCGISTPVTSCIANTVGGEAVQEARAPHNGSRTRTSDPIHLTQSIYYNTRSTAAGVKNACEEKNEAPSRKYMGWGCQDVARCEDSPYPTQRYECGHDFLTRVFMLNEPMERLAESFFPFRECDT